MSARFSQSHGIIPLVIDGSWSAGFTSDTINMANYNHCTIIMTGDSSVATNGVITVYASDADGDTDAAVTFTYRYAGGNVDATLSDVYTTPATSAALTATAADLDDRTFIIEVDAEDMNVSGTQYNFLNVQVDSSGSAGTVTMVAILSEPRYQKDIMPTANPI